MADLIDTNAFIRSGRDYYRFDTFPGFWDWLADAIASGMVILLPEVLGELKPRSDLFRNWLDAHGRSSYPSAAEMSINEAFRLVNRALRASDLEPASVSKFKAGADYHLVAWALAGGHRVVTLEEPAGPNQHPRPAKIPDICRVLEIRCINPFEMLSDHGARFIRPP